MDFTAHNGRREDERSYLVARHRTRHDRTGRTLPYRPLLEGREANRAAFDLGLFGVDRADRAAVNKDL
ncbi:MAG TPA: hypothetical protein VFK32_00500 [Tepidiformaceae bacterium]|nr:hypothetical protein [Tepidiformaceae bacterium]